MTTHPLLPAVTVERTFAASPGRVYRAWLAPALLAQWLAPGDNEVLHAEVEERVGGTFRVMQSRDGKPVGGCEGEVLELVPDERIVLRWGWSGPMGAAGPVYDSRLTITLRPAEGGGTVLTLVHEHLEALAAVHPEIAYHVDYGWSITLDKLQEALAHAMPSPQGGEGRP